MALLILLRPTHHLLDLCAGHAPLSHTSHLRGWIGEGAESCGQLGEGNGPESQWEVRHNDSDTWLPMQVGLDEALIGCLMSLCGCGGSGEGLGTVALWQTNRSVVTTTQSHMPTDPGGPRSQMGGCSLMGHSH